MRAKILFLIPVMVAFAAVNAQSPAPVIVQPANQPATSVSAKTVAPTGDAQSIPAAIKLLEQIKASNAEVLSKQKAALERLDTLQDDANQLKIYAKRG
jgi:hypothetical protein